MRILYNIFFLIFGIIYLPYLLFKGKLHRDFLQKFSFLPEEIKHIKKPLWIHAVSVGEAAIATKLAKAIKETFPDARIVISTTTRTGNDMACKTSQGSVDEVFYFPLDVSFIVSRAVRLIDPGIYIMIETELWPNLLEELKRRQVPVILANGRISDNSFRNYGRVAFIVKKILNNISCFCMQSDTDAGRIIKLGASPGKVSVTGNMKFDVETPDQPEIGRKSLGFGDDDEILVAGSTHYPEESMVIDLFKELRERKKNLKLVLAPRHIERVEAIKIYIEDKGLSYSLFSDIHSRKESFPSGSDILLVDTIGHLKDIYNAATLVFVGGSMAKRGGQNPIEPGVWGKAVIFGVHMFNFREIADIFVQGGAAACVKDKTELKNKIEDLLNNEKKRREMETNALKIIRDNSGAIKKTVNRIGEYMAVKR